MKNKKAKEAKRLLQEIRHNVAKRPNPFAGMTKAQVIKVLRKTREKLWEEKLASCSRL